MKTITATILAFILIIISISGCGSSDEPYYIICDDGERVIKIGVLASTSSDTLGIEYAHFNTPMVEIAGIVYNVDLVVFGDMPEEEESLTAAQFFLDKGVSIIISACGYSSAMIMGYDDFRQAGIAIIGISPTNSDAIPASNRYFGIYSLDPSAGQVLAAFAKERFNPSTAYVLANRADCRSIEFAAYFKEAFERENIIYEIFPSGTSDISPYIASAKAAGAQILLASTLKEYAALIIDQMHTQGLNIPIFAGGTWSDIVPSAAFGKEIEIYIASFYIEGGSPQFETGFRDWATSNSVSSNISDIIITGYDAYNAAIEAIKTAGFSAPDAILSSLNALSFNSSVSGQITFSAGGNVKRSAAFIKLYNTQTGEWEPLTFRDV